MSGARRLPADMLLLRERQRRVLESHGSIARSDDAVLLERDALLDDTSVGVRADAVGSLALYRPLADVSLATIAWTGAIDHAELQNAIVCSEVRGDVATRMPSWLKTVAPAASLGGARSEPALFLELGPDEIDALDLVRSRLATAEAAAVIRAAALPSTISGADASTADLAGTVLTGYRRCSLVVAWQHAFGCGVAEDVLAQRDAAAVQLLSVLRALLGEI